MNWKIQLFNRRSGEVKKLSSFIELIDKKQKEWYEQNKNTCTKMYFQLSNPDEYIEIDKVM